MSGNNLLDFTAQEIRLFSYKIMVRRSARLRNKGCDENGSENEGFDPENGQETLENLVKRTYELIKEKVENNRASSRSDVAIEKEDGQQKVEEFISMSSRVKDNVSKSVLFGKRLRKIAPIYLLGQ
jgi:hypothetical protein